MKAAVKLAIATVCLAGMWTYVDRVLVGHQVADSAAHGIPRGNLSDLYPIWLASREMLLHRRDPYSAEVTREIQAGYYGRPLQATRPEDPTNRQAFAYPVYVALLLAPTIELPFSAVRIIFFWVLAALTAISVLLWLDVLRWDPAWSNKATLILLALATFAVVQGIKLQQLSLLVTFLIAASLVMLASGQLALSGVLLAVATIKPQLTLPLAAWLLLWACASWRSRWRFAASFVVSSAGLILAGEYLLPGWITKFYRALLAYRQYAAGGRLLDQMITSQVGLPLLALVIAVAAAACWHERSAPADSQQFRGVTCLILAVTLLMIPMYPPHYQLLLLPGVCLLLRFWRQLWTSGLAARILLGAVAIPLMWSWIPAVALSGLSFFTRDALRFWELPLWPSVVLPVPVTACLGLLLYRQSKASAN